jgi:hypothetical protein
LAKKSKDTQRKSKGKKQPTRPSIRPFHDNRIVIDRLGSYFDHCNYVMKPDEEFWFRGQADINWKLVPSALRYETIDARNKALGLVSEFKRVAEIKLTNPPRIEEQLKWIQLARHYGLPTRLLDWTRNAGIALFFACCEEKDKDGSVYILNPKNLNSEAELEEGLAGLRVFDAGADAEIIKPYLNLSGAQNEDGIPSIAIYPVWNSERIVLQQGVFTLAGSKEFALTNKQAPGLYCLEIKKEYKKSLRMELERVGINEMAIFPEPEHTCNYLMWRERLDVERNI